MRKVNAVSVMVLLLLLCVDANAYIGPGVAAGTLAIVLGILSSIFLAFVGIVWYPIKRLLRKRKGKSAISTVSAPKEMGSGKQPERDLD